MRHFILCFAIFLCIFSDCYVSAYNEEQFLPKSDVFESDVINISEDELNKIIQKHIPSRKKEHKKNKTAPHSKNPYIRYETGERHAPGSTVFDFNTVHIPITPPVSKKEPTIPVEPVIEQGSTPPLVSEPVEKEENARADFSSSVVPPFSNDYSPREFFVIKALEAFRNWSTVTRYASPYVAAPESPESTTYNYTPNYTTTRRPKYQTPAKTESENQYISYSFFLWVFSFFLLLLGIILIGNSEKKAPDNNGYKRLKLRRFDRKFEEIFSRFKIEVGKSLPYDIEAGSLEEKIFYAECIFCIVINAMMYAGIKYNTQISDNKKMAFGYLAVEQILQIFDKAKLSTRLLGAYSIRVYEYSTQIKNFIGNLPYNDIDYDKELHMDNFFVASLGHILEQYYRKSCSIISEKKPLYSSYGNIFYYPKPAIEVLSQNVYWIIFNAVKQYAQKLRDI